MSAAPPRTRRSDLDLTAELRPARSLALGERAELFNARTRATSLVTALRKLGSVSVLNLPEDDPAAGALRSLGANVVVQQHEMLLELAH